LFEEGLEGRVALFLEVLGWNEAEGGGVDADRKSVV
jgi:hypothetical protein